MTPQQLLDKLSRCNDELAEVQHFLHDVLSRLPDNSGYYSRLDFVLSKTTELTIEISSVNHRYGNINLKETQIAYPANDGFA